MATADDLARQLRNRVGFEVVQRHVDAGRVYMLGRLLQSPANMALMAHHLMTVSQQCGGAWTVDISQPYVLRSGRVLKAWRFLLQGQDIDQAIDQVFAAMRQAPTARRGELDEFPLAGAGSSREGQDASGKGAAASGKAMIGRR